MKAKLKYLFKAAVLMAALWVCVSGITYVVRDKTNAEYIYPFRKEKEGTIDVVFVGSSHMYRSVYPLEIWHDFGITSWNLGSSEQSLGASYHLVKEAIAKQHPKVAVMEMYMSFVDSKYYDYARIHQITDNLPFSVNKLQFIQDLIPCKDRLEFYFPICKYHERWSELDKKDFQRIQRDSKGVEYGGKTESYPEFEILGREKKREVPATAKEYIEKTKELCDENGVELVLLAVPYQASGEYAYRQEILNGIYDIAEELDVPYINMFHEMEEVGFDYDTDFEEWQHLNINGAKKVSSYLGRFLTERYGLESRRQDGELSRQWDISYENSLIEQEKAWR